MPIKINDSSRSLANATPHQLILQFDRIVNGLSPENSVVPWPGPNSGTELRMTQWDKGYIGVFGDWVVFTEFNRKYKAFNTRSKHEISTYETSLENGYAKGFITAYLEDKESNSVSPYAAYGGPVPNFTPRPHDARRPAPRLLPPPDEITPEPTPPPAAKVDEIDPAEAVIAKLEKELENKARIAKLTALLNAPAPEPPKPAAPAPVGGMVGYTAKEVASALMGILFVLIQILPLFIPNNGPAIRSDLAQANADAMKYQTDRDTALFTVLKQMSDKQDLVLTKTSEMLTSTNAMLGNLVEMISKMTSTFTNNVEGSKSVQQQETRYKPTQEFHKTKNTPKELKPWTIVEAKIENDDTTDQQKFYEEEEEEEAKRAAEKKQKKTTYQKINTPSPKPPPTPVMYTWPQVAMVFIGITVMLAVFWSFIETLKA